MNAKEVLDSLCNDGWDYALRCGFSADNVNDPDVKKAVQGAADALERLETVLKRKLGEEQYEEIVDSW